MQNKKKNRLLGGQGLVEYILITVLISAATMVIFRSFRGDLQKAYEQAGKSLVTNINSQLTPREDNASGN